MGNIKILKSKDIKLEWDGALGRADLLPGACPTVKTYKCVLKAGNEYVPELYSRADRFQFFVFINASGFVVSGISLTVPYSLRFLINKRFELKREKPIWNFITSPA